MDRCREINPGLSEVALDVGRTHLAACHLWSPDAPAEAVQR